MARPPAKVLVNQTLTRLTGYHLAHGKPGAASSARMQQLERALAESRERVRTLDRELARLRAIEQSRATMQPTRKLKSR